MASIRLSTKKNWDLYGDEIFTACCGRLDRGYFPPSINDTNIALILKVDSLDSLKYWRPVSLCNVIYKLVSKVLANRLKVILHKCISLVQSAFVPGRSILDNAMIATEIIHFLKSKRRGKKGEVALKIDMSKAYDKVDWGYLKAVMFRLGFQERWVRWIMQCVESVNYSVLVNMEHVGPIQLGRGLRQGDPLSLYFMR